MSRAQLEKSLEWVDDRIKLEQAYDSSDGGLIESIRLSQTRAELFAAFEITS